MKIFVTGVAGFIGFHAAQELLKRGDDVFGIDNLNDYYDVSLKQARLDQLKNYKNFRFKKIDICHQDDLDQAFQEFKPEHVIHLAAQAGVRYSIENPRAYIDSNLVGFLNILEGCRHHVVKHLVYASSSSVYGANETIPFSIHDNVDHPMSLYAATKKSNELMAHSYASLYKLSCTGLRFFTVYGPWGRPDMACYSFTKAIFEGKAIDVYNEGNMKRDFTYIDDIVQGIIKVSDHVAVPNQKWSGKEPNPATSYAPYRIYNIGNNDPIPLMEMITGLEQAIGIEAKKNMMPMQAGDVLMTYANIDELMHEVGFKPMTKIEDGLKSFVKWYKSYYNIV